MTQQHKNSNSQGHVPEELQGCAGIPKLPNLKRGQWPNEPELGLTSMGGKGQMIPKWEADGCFRPADSGRNMPHKILLAKVSNQQKNTKHQD